MSLSHPGGGEARFLPGNIVAGRYRVVGLLGRGGMGEVYRADDLKLGQPVALKFLPESVEGSPDRLRRFLNEVRLALRITHSNVCRVYDIGEVEGQHYISMEYVDGEDLASLLRRIGRLPEDRGVAIARQICAGLAAAHEQGILHRDLKPANIMIDGRGRARITDFGLADLAGDVEGAEVRAGTPAYMAPEQLAGKGVSERSDIYSLGLVLYELFTGKPAFAAGTTAELMRQQSATTPSSMSSQVHGLDPAIEAAILRALDPDPARRPGSALALANALPGGDPLAAALAAGETPSPEMVADAGGVGGMAPLKVALALMGIVAGLALCVWLTPFRAALPWVERPLSLVALNERARLTVERLGYGDPQADTAHGVDGSWDYFEWVRKQHRDEIPERMQAGRPAPVYVWHRQSPRPLVPLDLRQRSASEHDPPERMPGMVHVQVDPKARLLSLEVVPGESAAPDETADQVDGSDPDETMNDAEASPAATPGPPDWAVLFKEAGLDPDRFTPAEPARTPPHYVDTRAAWEGSYPEAPDMPIRVEAGGVAGRPVWFQVFGPWSKPEGEAGGRDDPPAVPIQLLFVVTFLALMISVAVLGRRSLLQGSGDRRGATRIAAFVLITFLAADIVLSRYFDSPLTWLEHLATMLMAGIFFAALAFLAYMGLEPYVRRVWPETLISWSRFLAGRLRDPLVGRDVLIGAAAGVLTLTLNRLHILLPDLLGLTAESRYLGSMEILGGPVLAFGHVLSMLPFMLLGPMMMVIALVMLRRLTGRTWAAIGLVMTLMVTLMTLGSPHPPLDLALGILSWGVTLAVMIRIGLLAAVALWAFDSIGSNLQTFDPGTWEGPAALINGALLLALAGYAAWAALGGRALLADDEPAAVGAGFPVR